MRCCGRARGPSRRPPARLWRAPFRSGVAVCDRQVRSRIADEVPGLLRYARTTAPDGQLAEDLVQDTLLRALQRAESFRGEASLVTWLHHLLHNLAVDRFRRDREDATGDVEREVEDRWPEDPYTVDAATVVERAESRKELEDALVRLPVIYRTVVVLHGAEGMTVAQIADVQGVGRPAAKARLRRGRMMLVDALAQRRAAPGGAARGPAALVGRSKHGLGLPRRWAPGLGSGARGAPPRGLSDLPTAVCRPRMDAGCPGRPARRRRSHRLVVG
jgi:RNA polymerase sigma factor (sigma-70 family)